MSRKVTTSAWPQGRARGCREKGRNLGYRSPDTYCSRHLAASNPCAYNLQKTRFVHSERPARMNEDVEEGHNERLATREGRGSRERGEGSARHSRLQEGVGTARGTPDSYVQTSRNHLQPPSHPQASVAPAFGHYLPLC